MSVGFAPDSGVPRSNNWGSEQCFSKYYFVVISGSSFWFQCDSCQGWRAAGSIFTPASSPALPLPVWPQPGHSTGNDQHLECVGHWQVDGEWPAKYREGVCCQPAVYQRSSWDRCILWKEGLCRKGWGTALERRSWNPWMSWSLCRGFALSLTCERIFQTLFVQPALKFMIYLKWGLSTLVLLWYCLWEALQGALWPKMPS